MQPLKNFLPTSTIGSSTIVVNKVNPIGSDTIVRPQTINPIQRINSMNDDKTVDLLLQDCSDLIDSNYKGWFAKRFYKLNRDSVISGASLARKEGKWPQRHFTEMVKTAL